MDMKYEDQAFVFICFQSINTKLLFQKPKLAYSETIGKYIEVVVVLIIM